MTEVTQIRKFYTVLGELFDGMGMIIEALNSSRLTTLAPGNVKIVKDFIMSKDPIYLIDTFIKNSEEYWEKIKQSEDDYFINNSSTIFGEYANDSQLNALKVIFGKDVNGKSLVDDGTKNCLREYLFSLIKISIVHIFESRSPTVEKLDGKVKIIYKNKEKYKTLDIVKHAKIWNVKLW